MSLFLCMLLEIALISFFSPTWIFSFPSTAYRRDCLFPIVYYCLLCFRLGDREVSGWYTDILNYDIFINPFIKRNHRHAKSMDEKILPQWRSSYFRIYDRPEVTESSLLHLPHHLYHESFRGHDPDFSDLFWFSAPYTCIFVQWKSVIPGSLVCFCLCPPNPDDLHFWW